MRLLEDQTANISASAVYTPYRTRRAVLLVTGAFGTAVVTPQWRRDSGDAWANLGLTLTSNGLTEIVIPAPGEFSVAVGGVTTGTDLTVDISELEGQ